MPIAGFALNLSSAREAFHVKAASNSTIALKMFEKKLDECAVEKEQ